ncbi:hypothetical protein CWI39_1241p0010, partial [Hamiltosporidium magnivora]
MQTSCFIPFHEITQCLSDVISQRNIVIVSLQELESTGKRNVNKKSISRYYSCHEKHHLLGTEFMVGNKIKPLVIDFQSYKPKQSRIKIKEKKLNYYPQCICSRRRFNWGGKEGFYAPVGKVYEDCPRKYIRFLLGDMDAKIGKDYVCSSIRNYTLHKEHSENGFRLINFAIRGNLILGTVFYRGNIHKGHRIPSKVSNLIPVGKGKWEDRELAGLIKSKDGTISGSRRLVEYCARKRLINKYKVWSDNGDSMDRDSNRLEVFSDRTGLEGVSDSNRLEVVSKSIDNYKSVYINTNTLHPVNTNTTSFTLWNSFVFG